MIQVELPLIGIGAVTVLLALYITGFFVTTNEILDDCECLYQNAEWVELAWYSWLGKFVWGKYKKFLPREGTYRPWSELPDKAERGLNIQPSNWVLLYDEQFMGFPPRLASQIYPLDENTRYCVEPPPHRFASYQYKLTVHEPKDAQCAIAEIRCTAGKWKILNKRKVPILLSMNKSDTLQLVLVGANVSQDLRHLDKFMVGEAAFTLIRSGKGGTYAA